MDKTPLEGIHRLQETAEPLPSPVRILLQPGHERDGDMFPQRLVRRLLIARGLVHSPRLVLLDEPTVGLDPQVRAELWTLIDELRSQGVTVLMSTHYIEEAQRLSDDVAMMSHGRVVARGQPRTLMAEHVGKRALEYYGSAQRLREVAAAATSS